MSEQWREIDAYLKAHHVRIGPPTQMQTTGGGHSERSYHYAGTARDYGLWDSDAEAVARCLHPVAAARNSPLAELFFGPLNIWYQDGRRVRGDSIGGHMDHCHAALVPGRHLTPGRATTPVARKGITQNPKRAIPVAIHEPWQEIDEFLKRRGVRIGRPTQMQTTGGRHSPTSYHYRGLARDYGLWDSDAHAAARALLPVARARNSPVFELFFAPLNIWYKSGCAINGNDVGGHDDHVHVALHRGRHLIVAGGNGQGVGGLPHVSAGGAAKAAGIAIPETVDYGSCGPAVALLQTELTNKGYRLAADGQFGPKTEAAVIQFQQSCGLAADGIVGPKTWHALLR